MARYAQLDSEGKVINIVLADSPKALPTEILVLISANQNVNKGDKWDGKVFISKERERRKKREITIEERIENIETVLVTLMEETELLNDIKNEKFTSAQDAIFQRNNEKGGLEDKK